MSMSRRTPHAPAFLAALLLSVLIASSARAACTSPAAGAGSMNWSGTAFQACDGTNWQALGGQWLNGTSGAISYSGGNIGIGTTSPAAKLHIYGGGLQISGTNQNALEFRTNAGGAGMRATMTMSEIGWKRSWRIWSESSLGYCAWLKTVTLIRQWLVHA